MLEGAGERVMVSWRGYIGVRKGVTQTHRRMPIEELGGIGMVGQLPMTLRL